MLTEEIIKVIFGKLIDLLVVVAAAYLSFLLRTIKNDIAKIDNRITDCVLDIDKLEDRVNRIDVHTNIIAQELSDHKQTCNLFRNKE